MKTFLAQHFSHLQAMVNGTVQKPSTASSFVDVWQECSRIGEQDLTQCFFNWVQCCGSVYQWVGDDPASSRSCSLVIAPWGRICKSIFGKSLYYGVMGVESWICRPRSWEFQGEGGGCCLVSTEIRSCSFSTTLVFKMGRVGERLCIQTKEYGIFVFCFQQSRIILWLLYGDIPASHASQHRQHRCMSAFLLTQPPVSSRWRFQSFLL